MIRARAYAKINLGLEILGRRDDGYHEVRTILQTVDFCDELVVAAADGDRIELVCSAPGVPSGEENLALRAARALAAAADVRRGARIELRKRIPPGRGLGGGSADAAACLLALDRLWGLGLGTAALARIGASLGADVPFFLLGGAAVAVGRGDEVYPLAWEWDLPIVLIIPDFAVSTAEAYGRLILTKRETTLKLRYFALRGFEGSGSDLDLVNDFESSTGGRSPLIGEYKRILVEHGALLSLMSGSGSAVFGVFRDDPMAQSAARALAARGVEARATRMLPRATYRRKRLEVLGRAPDEP